MAKGKGIVGSSKGDRAHDRMARHLDRMPAGVTGARPDHSFEAQLRSSNADWADQMEEIQLEQSRPDYLAAKNEAREAARVAFLRLTRREREELNLNEHEFVGRAVRRWKAVNRAKYLTD